MEGNLSLEAWGFEGDYAVYAMYDESAVNRMQVLQNEAKAGREKTVIDLPRGAILICRGTI
jgi:hypothetical protein